MLYIKNIALITAITASAIVCMEENKQTFFLLHDLPKEILCDHTIPHLDFYSAKNLITCCKIFYNFYNYYQNIPLTKENVEKFPFGVERLLTENPHMYTPFTSLTSIKTLLHFAKKHPPLIPLLIQHENKKNKQKRCVINTFFDEDTLVEALQKLRKSTGYDFFRAIQRNNIPMVKIFLTLKQRLTRKKDRYGDSPLHVAAYSSNTTKKMIQLLINKGCYRNDKNYTGETPLHLAIMNQHSIAIKTLISNKCDTSIPNRYGMTPADLAKNMNISLVIEQEENISCSIT